jgi:choice-of-anchor A domain-containing protein
MMLRMNRPSVYFTVLTTSTLAVALAAALAACAGSGQATTDESPADEAALGTTTSETCSDGSLGQFQVYVKKNIASYCSDYEGAVGAGGTVSLGKFHVNKKKPGAVGLRAGGSVSIFEAAIDNGAETSQLTQVRSAVTRLAPKANHAALASQMDCLSGWLSKGIAGTLPTGSQFGTARVGLYFFTMTHQELATRMPLTFTYPAGSMVVVNVTGTGAASLRARAAMATPSVPVVFNFVDATSLTIDAIEIAGTILAPKADVTFSNGVLKGSLYANSLTGGRAFSFSSSTTAAATHCAATTANQAGQINYVAGSLPAFLLCGMGSGAVLAGAQ